MTKKIISPISIDLGAKYTGVYLNHYSSGDMFFDGEQKHIIIVDENDKIWLQKSRTAKRHMRRSLQRRRLAKRFLRLVLHEELKLTEQLKNKIGNISLEDRIMGLMNRRGFSYLTEDLGDLYDDVDFEVIKNTFQFGAEYADLKVFSESFLKDVGNDVLSIKDVEKEIDKISADCLNRADKSRSKPKFTKDDKIVMDEIKNISKILEIYNKSKNEGQKHRKEYLENIKHDLEIILKEYKVKGVDNDALWKLIGNISNLQERFLRKYFNDIEFKESDKIDDLRIEKNLRRYLSRWYPDKKNLNEVENLKECKRYSEQGWRKFFFELVPHKTIPPYENQNNRGTQICQSLILNPKLLSEKYSGWRGLVSKIDKLYPEVNTINESNIDWKWARKLQMYLDRTSQLSIPKKIDETLRHLSSPDDLKLKTLLESYYEESYRSRYGFWDSEDKSNILSVCELKTKYKSNIKDRHLIAIIGDTHFNDLINSFESAKNKLFKKANDAQKDFGNKLKFLLNKNPENITDEEEKKNVQLLKKLDNEIKSFCADIDSKFGQGISRKFNNIYSFSQIYSILYSDDRSGFSKSCIHCTVDNENRMRENESRNAFATRLSTSAARPIDGSIARLLDTVAWKVTSHKIAQLQQNKNSRVLVPIFIEQNAFDFQESLIEIKKKDSGKGIANFKKSERKAKNKSENYYKSFDSKFDRIKEESKGICAYTGESLGDNGEYDHIIPASFSRNSNQSVLNSEVNLIYVSGQGNQSKGNKLKELSDLDLNHLRNVFGKDNLSEIEDEIRRNCKMILESDSIFSHEETRYLRYGLFIKSLRGDIIKRISFSTKAKVNGTQKYFAKILTEKLKKSCPDNIELDAFVKIVKSDEVSIYRKSLGQKEALIKKNFERQDIQSHAIDAKLACLVGIKNIKNYHEMLETDIEEDKIIQSIINCKNNFIIDRITAKSIQEKSDLASKSIFKDSLFGESFLPLIYTNEGQWKMGFSLENSQLLGTARKPWHFFDKIKDFLIYKGMSASEIDLEKEIKSKQWIYFTFNKHKVFKYIHEHHVHPSKENIEIFKIINKFQYNWKREDVASKLLNEKGELLEDLEKLNPTKPLRHPVIEQWNNCLNLAQELKNKKNEEKLSIEELRTALIEKFGLDDNNGIYKHKGVRKTYSLPMKASSNVSLRRRSPKGDDVFQSLSSEGVISNYVVADAENSEHDILPIFKKKNAFYKDSFGSNIEGKSFPSQSFYPITNLPSEIKSKGVVEYFIAPKTKERFYGRIKISKSSFIRLFEESPTQIQSTMLIKKGNLFDEALLGKARDAKIRIEEISFDFVIFTYQMDSTPKPIIELLNKHLIEM